jgi:hypothetical protein
MPSLSDGSACGAPPTIRLAVLKTSKFEAVYKQAGRVWFHPSPLPVLPAPAAALVVPRPPYVATVVEGAGGGVRQARREFPATSERGVGGSGSGRRRARGAVPRDGGQHAYPVGNERKWARFAGNEFVQTSPKVQFGQESFPKCATLDKILVHIC